MSEKSVTQNNKPANLYEKIQKLRLMDDVFMKVVFQDNPEAVQLVIRTITGKGDLVVKDYHLQYGVVSFVGHSVTLDILAEDANGAIYDIEIQRSSAGASPKRLRYYSSLIDANYLKKGQSYESLPEKYVIFIMEEDYFKKGEPLYEFVMTSKGNRRFELGDEQHIMYVNGKNDSDTKLGKLMQDFQETNPDKMYYNELKTRAKYYKTNEKGDKGMKSVVDEIYEDGEKAGRAEGKAEGKANTIMSAIRYLKKSSDKSAVIEQLMGMFELSREDATKYYMAA